MHCDRKSALAALLAIVLPIVLYLPTLGYGFVFDDRPLLIDNPVVQSPDGLGEILTTDLDPRARTQEAPTTNYLRPLFLALAAGLYAFFGAAPFYWHLVAILGHGLLGLLAYLLLRRERLGVAAALVAALVFSFHPAHVQSAAWVSGLQDLLFGVLALLACLAYRGSAARPAAAFGPLLRLGLAYALALLAKEPAVGLLLLVGLESVLPGETAARGRRPWAELALLAGLTLAYFLYRLAVLGTLAHPFPTAPAWPQALASVPVALLFYLRDLLLPFDLFLLHPARPVSSVVAPAALAALTGVLALLALAWLSVRRRPELARPLLFFACWLAPSLSLWAINPEWMVMDRYLLLPSLALGWCLVLLVPARLGRWRAAAAIVLLVAFAGLSALQMRVFRDEDRFWSAAIEADPASSTAWAEWGKRRADAGDLAAASSAIDRAIALDPRAQLPRLRRALLALRQGQTGAAVAELEQLTQRNPGYLPAWRNLVVARDRAGDAAGARSSLAEALRLFPNDPLLWSHQAVMLRGAGRREEALAAIRQAVALAPADPALRLREALLLAERGRREEARAAAARGLELDPKPELRQQLETLLR